ncbi:MAG: carboxypeptidase-like regulatory domain-containing protein [Polyangiaceae bacterium]
MPIPAERRAIRVGALAVLALLAACRSSDPGPEPGASPSTSATATASAAPSASSATPWTVTSSTFPVPRASVELVLNPQGLPMYSGATGSVEGTVTVKGPPAPVETVDVTRCPAALDTYGKLFRAGAPATPGGPRPLADAVVVVVGYQGFAIPEKNDSVHVTIGSNCADPTRTIAITYGQRLDVSNKTRALFAPYIEQAETAAVMVAPPLESGEPVKLYPEKAGRFLLKDQMAPFVHEDLYVFRHPLHAVTDTAGHYRIDGLPVRQLKVGVHHPAFEASAEAPVDVVAGVVQKVDLVLTYKAEPRAPASAARSTGRCLRWLDPATKKKCAQYDQPND